MNRALVEATVHSEVKAALDAEDPAWAKHGREVKGETFADKLTAKAGLLVVDHAFGTREQWEGWDGAKVATRLGASPISAVFSDGAGPISPFGQHRLGVVAIPHWMAPASLKTDQTDGAPPAPRVDPKMNLIPTVIQQTSDGFEFELAGQVYAYDADGLRKKD